MSDAKAKRAYHHGNLREDVVAAALDAIRDVGVHGVGLRDVARKLGVTHAAISHHFGGRSGVLAAVAAEGFTFLAARLEAAATNGDFGDVGVAYVQFAVDHPSHFAVMFRPELYDQDDAELVAAKLRSADVLYGSAEGVSGATGGDVEKAGVAGWAFVHGIATLWRDGALPPRYEDPVALAAETVEVLFQSSTAAGKRWGRRRA